MIVGKEHWCAILNPCAGAKHLMRDLKCIENTLNEMDVSIERYITSYKGHATDIARDLVERGKKNILVFGGDGTLNEVVNGIFSSSEVDKSSIRLALVPYGTGNDWARFWNLKKSRKNIKYLLKVLLSGEKHLVDVGCVKTAHETEQTHYFLNALGIGFDALVLKYASWIKNHFCGGAWVYSFAVFLAVLKHRSCKMNIECDGKHVFVDEPIYTMSIGNGCFTGGGLKQTPDAVPTDGFFHTTIIKKLSFLHIIKAAKYLFTGNLLKHPCVYSTKLREFTCESEENVEVEIDGILMPACKKMQVNVIPATLNFVTPK
jgi:diacylglycerol kinase (ATP)